VQDLPSIGVDIEPDVDGIFALGHERAVEIAFRLLDL
jgi:hypothetical protein